MAITKPGPARKGADALAYRQLQARVLELRNQGLTHAQIAAEVGLERSTITKLLPRALREVVPKETALDVLALELLRLQRVAADVFARIMASEEGPDARDVNAYVKVSRQMANLTGAFTAGREERQSEGVVNDDVARRAAEDAAPPVAFEQLANAMGVDRDHSKA